MANFICEFEGVRGRKLKLYDSKVVITTEKTVGSFLTGNFTDGEKTIYLCDVVGVQFKKSGLAIGYLQFETPSMQMNNKNDNFFSENTFTFEDGKYGITSELMVKLYNFVTDRIEELKYGSIIINEVPDFESMKEHRGSTNKKDTSYSSTTSKTYSSDTINSTDHKVEVQESDVSNVQEYFGADAVTGNYQNGYFCRQCKKAVACGQKLCAGCGAKFDWTAILYGSNS